MELKQFPILKEFEVVFCDKILVLPPKWYLDFTIDLISFSTPKSWAPYHMSILELMKWTIQLQEFLDKAYIHPSVSPWRVPILCWAQNWSLFNHPWSPFLPLSYTIQQANQTCCPHFIPQTSKVWLIIALSY